MIKPKNFQGAMTALITPFNKQGEVDYEALKKLVESQIKAGIDVLVPCGTTGESPTLSDDEKYKVVKIVIETSNGRVPVVAGAGGNNTKKAVEMTKKMKELGVDGVLSVCPYYNKPTQKGFYLHFKSIAEATDLPIILYNIPGRTAKMMDNDTTIKLAKEFPTIVAMKEATGNMENMKDLINRSPEGFNVVSGDDGMTLELIKNGGKGVISVATHLVPEKIKAMVDAALKGNFEEAEKINSDLAPLFEIIFIETNPIPIKTALAMQGKIDEIFRLPMCEMEPQNKDLLRKSLEEQGLL